jgi:hypothetical protein
VNKKKNPSKPEIAIQSWLRPAITPVPANVDFQRFKSVLDDISNILETSALEREAISLALESFPNEDARSRNRRAEFAVESLRIEILRHLLGLASFRATARMICSSDLLAQFCGLLGMDGIRGAGKSTIERRSKIFTEEQLRQLIERLTEACGNTESAGAIGLDEAVPMDVCLVDSTCLDANIHYPVDWVLLRDVSVTLIKAMTLVRGAGVKVRMPEEPKDFAGRMNRLCMEMTHSRHKQGSKKKRKAIFREMKRLLRTIGDHALRHKQKLEKQFDRTRFSKVQATRICERIQGKLDQIDTVIHQAHERIIGGRNLANKDKLLSVHESEVRVIKRGKAGRDVEFGNTLFISENQQGYITDWKLYRDTCPGENKQLAESLERRKELDLNEPVRAVCTDRGFAGKATSALLEKMNVFDASCPREVKVLRERMKEREFRELQKRRGGTEARIAILTNRWLGGKVRAKGHEHRALAVGWGVLAHNLWFIARKLADLRKRRPAAAA